MQESNPQAMLHTIYIGVASSQALIQGTLWRRCMKGNRTEAIFPIFVHLIAGIEPACKSLLDTFQMLPFGIDH